MEGVKLFLNELGMGKYFDMFKIKGFDDESDIPYLTSYDLQETIMVTCPSDRTTILSHAGLYRPTTEHAVYAWLCSYSLSYYFIGFIQSELTDLGKIAQLCLPNEDLYDELEIVLPGHRKRLERAVQRLKLEQSNDTTAEVPVTHGWWGKPECLPQAKFDFLCVKASLFSSLTPQNNAFIDFMVDSGSDVSTVQEDTLKKLNLELIGQVYSCGIHGGNHTNLYKGRLKVGDHELDIEVMGSNYDSLGSRIVRHFRHVIDGQQHIWLKGNYSDPIPAIAPIEYPVGSSCLSLTNVHQELLPITGVSNTESKSTRVTQNVHQQELPHIPGVSNTESIQGNLQLASRSNEDDDCAHLNAKKMKSRLESISRNTEHYQFSNPGQIISHISSLPNQIYTDHHATDVAPEIINPFKKPHSVNSSSYLSSHCKRTSLNGKGKRLTISGKGKQLLLKKQKKFSNNFIKSSTNRLDHSPRSSSSSDFSAPKSVAKPNTPAKASRNKDTSDSFVNSSRKSSIRNKCSEDRHKERDSSYPALPSSYRDTDDDIDNMEDDFNTSVFSYNPALKNNCPQMIDSSDTRLGYHKSSVNNSLSNSWDQNSVVQYDDLGPEVMSIDSPDIVHIGGLYTDVHTHDNITRCMYVDHCVAKDREQNKMEIDFIPACRNVKEIQIQEN